MFYTRVWVAAGVQTGEIVADVEPVDRHYWSDDGRARQPLLRPDDRHLHLRRDGHATVRRQLQREGVRSQTSLELRGLPPLVHDRLPRPVRRMDRVHVGLHLLFRLPLRSVLPADHDHWKPRSK